MLLDEIIVHVEAGDGGRGAVAFQKIKMAQGPTGGDGGRGGSVYFEAVADIGALSRYAPKKLMRAKDGGNGRGQFVDGKDGADLVLPVPVGTRILNIETNYARELERVGDRILAAGGGTGGRGNFKFRSGSNTSPREFEEGTKGDAAQYRLELRLIADVGLVGLPNAGKSSLLNELTAAKSKVAGYAFTTLEPHLGAYYGLVLADIPGLVEGASAGRGLGTKFLKHIERTAVLFHLVALDSEHALEDYRTVRNELAAFNPALVEKREYVFLSKADAVLRERVIEEAARFREAGIDAHPISLLDPESMERVRNILSDILKEK